MTRIRPLTFEVHNLRKIKDKSIEFPNAGIVLIKGGNEQGKSTFIEALKALYSVDNTTELSNGNRNGYSEGRFIAANGKEYLIHQDLSEGVKGSRFTLVDPDGKKTTKISDIRDLIGFNPVVLEDFIAKGEYEKGKREQRDIVLNILPTVTKDTFLMLEADEKEMYVKRTNANNQELMLKNVVEKARPSQEDENKGKTIGDIEKKYLEAEKLHLNAYTALQTQKQALIPIEQEKLKLEALNKEYNDKAALYKEKDTFYAEEIAELERKLAAKKVERDNELGRLKQDILDARYRKDEQGIVCSKLQSIDITELEKDEKAKKEEMLRLKALHDDAKLSVNAMSNYFKEVHAHKEAKAIADKLDEDIKRIRREKDEVITSSEFPLKDVRICDEGIEVFVDDKWLPCSKSHIATSRLYCTVGKIAVLANRNFPVALISQGESVLSERMNWLLDFANENDAIFIVEKAVEGVDEVVCEIVEK